MILHASTKMDISNYVDWLKGRLEQKYFDRDLNGKIVQRISLDNIEKIYLYTKTPSKIYRNREIFADYNTRLITFLTQYDSYFEPKIKDKDKIMRCIKRCRKHFKENYFGYGPIFFTEKHSLEWHLAQFDFLCHELAAYTDGVYISFRINERCQFEKNMTCRPLDSAEQSDIIQKMEEIVKKHHLKLELMRYEEDFGEDEVDVGENNCCPYACGYCPYITNKEGAVAKYKVFNASSSILYGFVTKSQKIQEIHFNKEEKKETYTQCSLMELL